MIARTLTGWRTPSACFFALVGIRSRLRPVRRLFAICLLLALTGGTAADLCQGWSSHAAERASCCARMENQCGSWAPDDCCEKGEQRRTRDIVRAAPLPALDMTPGPEVVPMAFHDVGADLHTRIVGPRAHLLHSVFLI